MRSRAVRVTLTLLAVSAIGAAAYFSWTIDTRRRADLQAGATFHQTLNAALRDAFELRSAQQAYVATGQNETFWFGRAALASESLRAALMTLKSSTASQAVFASIEEAAAALQDFEQIDQRARGYASGGQKLLASDVIFSDGLEAAGKIIAALDQAGAALAESDQAAATEATRQQAMAAAGAAAFAILTLLLLMPVGAAPAATIEERRLEPMRVPDNNEGLDLGPLLDAEIRVTPARKIAPPAVSIAAPPPAPPAPAIEIQALASLCTDLARVTDTSLLPGLLERAATTLDASGLVLWIADPEGQELLPIAAHGYPASVLSRMGSLKTDAENATAAAFRTGLLQTVSADAMSNGAIAVPLVAPDGCRGVMSAEVRHDGEKQPARLAAASIVAAQLATLVGPPAARADERNTAAL